jgi:hypothetical protein
MEWLVILAVLAGLAALHEVVVLVLARACGAQARRRGVIVIVTGRKRGALAFAGAIAALYVAVC